MLELGGVDTVIESFSTDRIAVDEVSFVRWAQGLNATDAARDKEPALFAQMFPGMAPHRLKPTDAARWRVARKLNLQACTEQFQSYDWMLPHLNEPKQFTRQSLIIVSTDDVHLMVQHYYSFDETVMREVMGKAFTKAVKRELEENSENLRCPSKAVRRQFDNMKRVMNYVETEIQNCRAQGRRGRTVLQLITEDFMMPLDLASQYQNVIFLCANKIETFKSRLNFLDFTEWNSLAGVVMAMWGSEYGLELNVQFTEHMRQFKDALAVRETLSDYRKHIINTFRTSISDNDASISLLAREQANRQKVHSLENNLSNMLRAMAQIGAGLQEWREVRDIFIDILEKILEPLDRSDMSLEQVILLFGAMDKALLLCNVLAKMKDSALPQWALAWRKFVEGVKMVTITMYPKLFGRHV
mmetsp:Transcript_48713/g.76063  ORF Transcript_48713/g.76063 Transcript_48713/m.76063 type:complete len:414 (-) Transcript_48713:966-2207(-)